MTIMSKIAAKVIVHMLYSVCPQQISTQIQIYPLKIRYQNQLKTNTKREKRGEKVLNVENAWNGRSSDVVHESVAIMDCSRHRFVKKTNIGKDRGLSAQEQDIYQHQPSNSSWPWTLFSIDREKVEHGQVLAPTHMSEIACDVICAGTSATSGSYHQKRVHLHLHVDKHVQPHIRVQCVDCITPIYGHKEGGWAPREQPLYISIIYC